MTHLKKTENHKIPISKSERSPVKKYTNVQKILPNHNETWKKQSIFQDQNPRLQYKGILLTNIITIKGPMAKKNNYEYKEYLLNGKPRIPGICPYGFQPYMTDLEFMFSIQSHEMGLHPQMISSSHKVLLSQCLLPESWFVVTYVLNQFYQGNIPNILRKLLFQVIQFGFPLLRIYIN